MLRRDRVEILLRIVEEQTGPESLQRAVEKWRCNVAADVITDQTDRCGALPLHLAIRNRHLRHNAIRHRCERREVLVELRRGQRECRIETVVRIEQSVETI